jgi:hypothetical protein
MRRVLLAVAVVGACLVTPLKAQSDPCGLPAAVFCDTFDQPQNGGTRSGDLDPVVWGVSRTSGHVAIGDLNNAWFPTDIDACGEIRAAVVPPQDVVVCNGQLREATNDGHQVTTLAMYPKQPFDFAGRTGKVVFDVSNDALNTHDAWPEFWMSDKPVPAPFNHFDSWQALPQDGFGVRFAAGARAGEFGYCQNGNNLDKQRWTVDSAVVVRNFVMDDTAGYGTRTALDVKQLDCVVAPIGPNGGLNHVELDISQNQIDVYATDAGTTAPLRHIAVVTNANLTLTRGLIWLEDAHYNAAKAQADENGPHRVHTFAWDNVAFDGPLTYHDLAYDAPDALVPLVGAKNADGSLDLGKSSPPRGASSWDVFGMPQDRQAAAVRVLFNFFDYTNPAALTVSVNGHVHQVAWPYPDTLSFTWRTLAVTIPISDLVTGTNVVQIGSEQSLLVSNVDIVLVDAGAPVPTPTPALTATPTPTDTPAPVTTPTTDPTPTAMPDRVDCAVNVRIDGVERGWTPC